MTSNGYLPTRADLLAAGINIAVAVPMERTAPGIAFAPFWAIANKGWPLIVTHYGRTDVQRNQIARELLGSEFTHVCMLDLDHLHPPNTVEQLAARVIEAPDRLVVGGLNFRRGAPFDPCAFTSNGQGLRPLIDWPARECIEVDAIGHGALLVHRSVFERIEPPWWAYDYGRAEEGFYPSEDMYFSYLCREAEISIWCDTGATSPHLIENVVNEDVWHSYRAQLAGG